MTYNMAKKICKQSECERVCIQIESWVKGGHRTPVEYSVWDGHNHFHGATLEFAMHAFMSAHPQKSEPEPDSETDAVFAEMGGWQ